MTPFRHISITDKLLGVIMITTSSALALACVVILLYDLLLYRESMTQELMTQADIIGSNSTTALVLHDSEAATNILHALRFQPSITHATIFHKNGLVLATYDSESVESSLSNQGSLASTWTKFMSYSMVREIIHQNERIGTIYLESSFEELFDRWTGFVGIVIGVLFASSLFGLVLSSRFQKFISDPILRLTTLAKRISTEKDYSLRETSTSQDEIGTLIEGINDMLEQIQTRDRQLEQHRENLEGEVIKRTIDLAQLHQQIQLILQTAGDGIFGVDTGDTITFINPAAAHMLGYDPEGLVGQSFHSSVHHSKPDGSPRHLLESPIYRSCSEGREFHVENEVLWRNDGTGFEAEYTSIPMRSEDGTLLGAVVTFRDITERRQVEQSQLEAKQAAELANQAKSQFLANMSHEIRTPMSGVLGMTELLLNSPLSDRQKHYAETVLRSGRNLLRIINDILDYSKMEAGKFDLEAIDFPFHTTLEDAVELFAETAQGKSVELVSIIDTHLPEYAVGDPSRLTQVLTNLIGNALKFTAQGEILIRARLDSQAMDHFRVRIEVQDTGIGIPLEIQQHIFDAFSQADGSTTRKYGGTGLGLAISRELVELMGGQLQVSSDGTNGSCFFFSIPLKPGAQVPHHQPPMVGFHGARALLIEDHGPTATMIAEWLHQWGLTVSRASSGEQALLMLADSGEPPPAFDYVMIDFTLPGGSGLDLVPRIRTLTGPHPPACLLLAPWHLPEKIAQLCRTTGLLGTVHKPLRRSQFFNLLCQEHPLSAEDTTSPQISSMREPQHTACPSILLAEDQTVNQEIVKAMAHHLHFDLDIVDNGNDAVEALLQGTYDLVLMDWQMPGLDGLSACQLIRKREIQNPRQPHLPIIAFTALNSPKDREQCLEAGIDDILSKPCDMEQVRAILAKWVPSPLLEDLPTSFPHPQTSSSSLTPIPGNNPGGDSFDASALDRIKALQRPGRPSLVMKVLTTYLDHTPKLLHDLRDGTAQQDPTRVRGAAHTLKSSSASVGAIRMADLCRELEEQAKAHNLAHAESTVHQITAEYEFIHPTLAAMCTEDVHG